MPLKMANTKKEDIKHEIKRVIFVRGYSRIEFL